MPMQQIKYFPKVESVCKALEVVDFRSSHALSIVDVEGEKMHSGNLFAREFPSSLLPLPTNCI